MRGNMKTDIEIAQEAVMEPIEKVAAALEIGQSDLNFMESTRRSLRRNT